MSITVKRVPRAVGFLTCMPFACRGLRRGAGPKLRGGRGGGERQGACGQWLAPLQKLLVLLLPETWGHLTGRVAWSRRWLLLLLLLGAGGGTLAIATAASRGQGQGQAGVGRVQSGAGLGRVWHCVANTTGTHKRASTLRLATGYILTALFCFLKHTFKIDTIKPHQ